MHNYVIALYIRLSVEDFKTESLSIPNQKLILREKAMSLSEWDNSEILEFIDNGHTGTNFERPAVQELLTMVQAGKINCIIVKDLSRFGRNSIETGYFIERVFPLYHTRFISVSDDFDTANFKGDTGGIDIAFKYLISECYSRDMSMKTKSAKYAKMRRGEYQSVICPYGYRKSADGRMEPDEDVAPNVQMIFQWASEGNTAAEITRKLYVVHVSPHSEHASFWRHVADLRDSVFSQRALISTIPGSQFRLRVCVSHKCHNRVWGFCYVQLVLFQAVLCNPWQVVNSSGSRQELFVVLCRFQSCLAVPVARRFCYSALHLFFSSMWQNIIVK